VEAEAQQLEQKKRALQPALQQIAENRNSLEERLRDFESRASRYEAEVMAFATSRKQWEKEWVTKDQVLQDRWQNLEMEKSRLDQEKARWNGEVRNRQQALDHSQAELQRNFGSLTTRETELKTLRDQIQKEWAALRESESQLNRLKRDIVAEQQRQQAEFIEKEAKLNQWESTIREKQRMADLNEIQNQQRQETRWIANVGRNQTKNIVPRQEGQASPNSNFKNFTDFFKARTQAGRG